MPRPQPDFPRPDPTIPRLRNSGIECYLGCGWCYYLREVEKAKRITSALARGIAVHEASGTHNLAKRDGKPLPSRQDVVDLAVSEYDIAIRDGGEVMDKADDVSAGRDLAAGAAGAWEAMVAPRIPRPILVERPTLIQFQTPLGPLEVQGTIDCAHLTSITVETSPPTMEQPGAVIRDTKTGKRLWTPDRAHGSTQMSTYGALYQAETGKLPDVYIIDSLQHTKKYGWRCEHVVTTRTEEDIASWWELVYAVESAIRAGVFPPAAPGSWKCSPKYCEYFMTCKFVATRRRFMAEEDNDG